MNKAACFNSHGKSFFYTLRNERSHILLFLLCGLLLFSCHKKDVKIQAVASINNLEITREDFAAQFKTKHPDIQISQAETSVKQQVLDDMIDQQLILMEAYRLGYDKDRAIIKSITDKEQDLAAEEYINNLTGQEPVTEDLLREYYDLMHKVFDFSYIELKIRSNETEMARNKALEVYRQLKSEANFHQMAASRSEHGSAAADSGRYTTVNCFAIDKTLFKRLYAMKTGEISEPVQSGDAFFILKVDKIFPQKLADYQVLRNEIVEELDKLQQSQKSQKTRKIELALRNDFHYSLFSENIELFCVRTKQMKTKSDTSALFNEQENKLPLSKTDIEEITIGEFFPKVVEYYWDSLFQKRVAEMLLEYMNTKRLLKHQAMTQKVNESPKIKDQLSVFMVTILKQHVVKKQVLDKMEISDAGLRRTFTSMKSNFKREPQVTVHEIFCRSKTEADKVHALSATVKDFALLQKKYSQDEETRTNGVLGPFSKGRHGKLGEIAFSGMKAGEISEPFKYRGGYSFFKLLSYEPEKYESFDAVKEKIKSHYIEENMNSYVSDWLKKIRTNYQIQYYALP